MSAYISNRHAAAQHNYANRHGANGRRLYVSATGSDGDRGGRGRGNDRATRTYINNVDVMDPHRNFTSAEWEKLGTIRRVVIQIRDGNNRIPVVLHDELCRP